MCLCQYGNGYLYKKFDMTNDRISNYLKYCQPSISTAVSCLTYCLLSYKTKS